MSYRVMVARNKKEQKEEVVSTGPMPDQLAPVARQPAPPKEKPKKVVKEPVERKARVRQRKEVVQTPPAPAEPTPPREHRPWKLRDDQKREIYSKRKELSQSQLATMYGVSQPAISYIVRVWGKQHCE